MSGHRAEAVRARAEADLARARLATTLHEVQRRLNPSTIAADALSGAKERGSAIANDAVEVARTSPLAVAGGSAALLALALVRPVFRALRRRRKVPAAPRS